MSGQLIIVNRRQGRCVRKFPLVTSTANGLGSTGWTQLVWRRVVQTISRSARKHWVGLASALACSINW